jgi:WD40 repeat protein
VYYTTPNTFTTRISESSITKPLTTSIGVWDPSSKSLIYFKESYPFLLKSSGASDTISPFLDATNGSINAMMTLGSSALEVATPISLYTAGDDHLVKLWSLPSGKLQKVLHGHGHPVVCLSKTPDETKIASGDANNTVIVRSSSNLDVIEFTYNSPQTAIITAMVFLNSNFIITSSLDGSAIIWDLNARRVNRTLVANGAPILCMASLSDGSVAV